MIYNIVDSVKGGCGKTSFSLLLAMALSYTDKSKPKNPDDTCLIDIDMLGTSIETLLFGSINSDESSGIGKDRVGESIKGQDAIEQSVKEQSILNKAQIYLNDFIMNSETNKRFLSKLEYKFEANSEGVSCFDIVISSPYEKDKQLYRTFEKRNHNGFEEISHGYYQTGLSELIDKLEEQGKKNLVFDMPPSVDGYSDRIFSVLLDLRKECCSPGNKTRLFLLTTLDLAHIDTTIEFLSNLPIRSSRLVLPDEIFIVINDIFGDVTENYRGVSDKENPKNDFFNPKDLNLMNAVTTIKSGLSKKVEHKEILDRVFYLYCPYQKAYQRDAIEKTLSKNLHPDLIKKSFSYLIDEGDKGIKSSFDDIVEYLRSTGL